MQPSKIPSLAAQWRQAWQRLKIERTLRTLWRERGKDTALDRSRDAGVLLEVPAELKLAFEQRLARSAEARRLGPSMRRLAWALSALLSLGLACQLPSSYSVEVGHRLVAHIYGEEAIAQAERAHDLERTLHRLPRISGISLHMLRRQSPDQLDLDLSLWGAKQEDVAAAVELLRQRYPWLATASMDDAPLATTFHGTLGSRMRHRLGLVTRDEWTDLRALAVQEDALPVKMSIEVVETNVTDDGTPRMRQKVRIKKHVP